MTEQERARWTKLVGDFETTDMTQREFATQRGISFGNLRNWIYKPRKGNRLVKAGLTNETDGAQRTWCNRCDEPI